MTTPFHPFALCWQWSPVYALSQKTRFFAPFDEEWESNFVQAAFSAHIWHQYVQCGRRLESCINSSMGRKGSKPEPHTPRTPSTPAARQPKDAKAAVTALIDGGPVNARGPRIFSHFGLPKPVSIAKGDIHPAILRLALQFSNFKITGANARCIATLTAFKTVCL